MKAILLLTLHTLDDTTKVAMVFSTTSLANSYINKIAHSQSTGIASLKKLQQNRYALQTTYGLTGNLSVDEVPDDQLRFYLLKSVNGTYRETRAFTSRQNAVNYVARFLDEYEFDPDEDENKMGSWEMESGSIDVKFHLKVAYTNNSDKLDEYYKILGISNPSTPELIRRAYRKRSKETHPDMGGNATEFRKVNKAYKVLINSSNDSSSDHKMSLNEIVASPDSADIEYVLDSMKQKYQKTYANSIDNTDGSTPGLIIIGLVMAGIGIAATSASYNSAEEGERYTIFGGLIVIGIYYVIRGIINLFKR